jgi:hypothetical protein
MELLPSGSLFAVLIALLSYHSGQKGLKATTEQAQISLSIAASITIKSAPNYVVHCQTFFFFFFLNKIRPKGSLWNLSVFLELRTKFTGIINYTQQTLS